MRKIVKPVWSRARKAWRAGVIQPGRELARATLRGKQFGYAQGSFSALESLRQGKLRGREILLDQGSPQIPQDSIMVRSKLAQHLEQPWPIFWTLHPETVLRGESLAHFDENQAVCAEACYGSSRVRTDPAYNTLLRGAPERLTGNWTSLVSNWCPANGRLVYAHWLFDALPRLAPLGEFPPDTQILLPAKVEPFERQMLEWLGLWERCRPTSSRALQIENYFFSNPTSMIVCYNPYAAAFLREKFLRFQSQRHDLPRRFYLSRGVAPFRSAKNETEVANFFRQKGWAVIDPGAMNIADQIALFANAEAIIGIHGAAFANLAWCSPGTIAIELFAENYPSGCYEWLAQTVQARHRFLIFPADERMNSMVDLKQVEGLMAELRL